jgi:hypothetical protein
LSRPPGLDLNRRDDFHAFASFQRRIENPAGSL